MILIPMRVGDLTPREAAEVLQQLLDHLGAEIWVEPSHEPALGRPRAVELRIARKVSDE